MADYTEPNVTDMDPKPFSNADIPVILVVGKY